MSIVGVSHVAIGVRDMDRSLVFYRDVLGLRVRYDGIERLAASKKLGPDSRRAVFLDYTDPQDAPTSSFLVLDQRPDAEQFGQPAEIFQLGIHHFAFWVDDLEAILKRAADAGFVPFYGPNVGDALGLGELTGETGTHDSCLFKDPDGNVVQCDHRLR